MVDVVRRRSRRKARNGTTGATHSVRRLRTTRRSAGPYAWGASVARRAADRPRLLVRSVGCPAPGAHPVSPTWQMQATVDTGTIGRWWAARPDASVILVTGASSTFWTSRPPWAPPRWPGSSRPDNGGSRRGSGTRMLFFVTTRGAPVDEDEWWSCRLDCEPENITTQGSLRWHCATATSWRRPQPGEAGWRAGSVTRPAIRCRTRLGCWSIWLTPVRRLVCRERPRRR